MKLPTGLVAAGVVACLFAPTAPAHHSEPYCYWGKGVLPESELVTITLEHPRLFERCEYTRIRVRAGNRYQVTVEKSGRPSAGQSGTPAKLVRGTSRGLRSFR